MMKISIGLDIDGTITANPNLFARLSREVCSRGGEVHVVSSRSECARDGTLEELRGYDIQFDRLYLIPSLTDSEVLCPHPAMGWYDKFLWGKVGYALDQGLTHFVDDDIKVAALFHKYAENIVFVAADRADALRL
jgi:hypothetical protein